MGVNSVCIMCRTAVDSKQYVPWPSVPQKATESGAHERHKPTFPVAYLVSLHSIWHPFDAFGPSPVIHPLLRERKDEGREREGASLREPVSCYFTPAGGSMSEQAAATAAARRSTSSQ